MKNKSIKRIGIFGFGCVGQGLYDVLQDHQQLQVAKICVRDREKLRTLPADTFTYNPQDLLQDESIDLLAELISDPEEALALVRQALRAGKTVVSANKKMVAENLPALLELQKRYGGVLLYEAAVCGSIPILRTLESYYGNEPLQEVCGILNGSSNYILSKLDSEGISYREALQQAQALGFAEADPTLDVEGHDALHKICIIAAHAYGVLVQPQEVLRFGISAITKKDIALAQGLGAKYKLVASARQLEGDRLEVQVLPRLVFPDDELYYVHAEFNGVQLQAKYAGNQFLKGRGAGSHPTGSAVWADIAAALAGYKYSYPKLRKATAYNSEDVLKIYLRADSHSYFPKLPWLEVTSFGVCHDTAQLLGTIRRKDLSQYQQELEYAGVFVAQVPVSVSAEDAVRASLLSGEVAA
ncbi:MAG: homoserine dehydrogenase [Hymenobacteraceae bacterium]|nr:homoserine dehydrogenase [Hymenobacteraceae bacterium]